MDLPTGLQGSRHEAFARSVLMTLAQPQKSVEPRWLYDAVGAKLFEAVSQSDHYYPTRTELALLDEAAAEIADALGEGVTIVEPGSGEALKVRTLLSALGARARGYVPIDIAAEQLERVAAAVGKAYPQLVVTPVEADFFRPFTMPRVDGPVVFFPGSTIGNMSEADGRAFLRSILDSAGADRLLVGFDLLKDPDALLAAYDDPVGISAAFAKNVLQRMNRELGATFDLSRWAYRASFDAPSSSIVMELVAQEDTMVVVAGRSFAIRGGETIHTEDSRKYTAESFAGFARGAGLAPLRTWTDAEDAFAVMLLQRA
ncbi:L-histidine N(alpha)-methyltransferase [Acuticoccus sp.]|uniref:L-histidine N(alpha)-methyltransferase n=1 Tax=Acuticoccus sp. TaxID=1904378 RepID=UPI003B52E130